MATATCVHDCPGNGMCACDGGDRGGARVRLSRLVCDQRALSPCVSRVNSALEVLPRTCTTYSYAGGGKISVAELAKHAQQLARVRQLA